MPEILKTRHTSPRVALIVRGGWEGHHPVEATDLFLPFLEENDFDVRVDDSPAVYADHDYMATVDLIVQAVTMSTIEQREVAGLRAAVEDGCGFAGWHGGIVDSYRSNTEYLQLVGCQFVAHPGKPESERTGRPDDNYSTYTVSMTRDAHDHPITHGIADFSLDTEQYWVLTDGYNDVLATTTQERRPGDPWHCPLQVPVVWTRQWGSGRVFVSTPGHRIEDLDNTSLRIIIERGLLWAAR